MNIPSRPPAPYIPAPTPSAPQAQIPVGQFQLPDPAAVAAAIAARKAASLATQQARPQQVQQTAPSSSSNTAALIGTPADIARVKSNIQKLIDRGATEADLDGYVKSEGYTPQALASAPQPQPDKPIMESFGSPRGLNLGIRSTLEGAASPVYLGADALAGLSNLAIKGYNAATGSNVAPMSLPSTGEQQTLDQWFGTPQGWENVPAEATKFAASVPTMAGAAAVSGAKALAPLAENIGPQLIGAGAAGASGGTVRATMPPDSPWTPWAELAASLAGGGIGGAAGSIGPTAAKPTAQGVMNAMQRSGIKSSLGDVTQNPLIQIGQKVVAPFASGREFIPGTYVPEQETQRLGQAQNAASSVANRYGTPMSNIDAGKMLQRGVQNYRYGQAPAGMTPSQIITAPTWQTSIAAKANALYGKVPVSPNVPIPLPNTTQALTAITSRYANPDLQEAMGDPTIARWSNIINSANGQLSWSDLRNLRTDLRYLQSNSSLTATVDDRALSQLNAALTADMKAGAFHVGGTAAETAVTRADNFYATAMGTVNRGLTSIFKAPTPEAAYGQFEKALSSTAGGDMGKLSALRRAIGPDGWGDLAATWLDRAGNPQAGQAGVPGQPQFSVSTFLTNYNKLSPVARTMLFNGTGQSQIRSSLDDLTTALGAMRGTDKLANTSKTASHVMVGAGALEALYQKPVTTASALLAANLSARAFYNPTFIKLATMGIRATRPQMQAQFMAQAARVAQGNPALAQDVQSLVQSLMPRAAAAVPGATPNSPSQNNRQ